MQKPLEDHFLSLRHPLSGKELQFMQFCFKMDPADRSSCDDLLASPLFESFSFADPYGSSDRDRDRERERERERERDARDSADMAPGPSPSGPHASLPNPYYDPANPQSLAVKPAGYLGGPPKLFGGGGGGGTQVAASQMNKRFLNPFKPNPAAKPEPKSEPQRASRAGATVNPISFFTSFSILFYNIHYSVIYLYVLFSISVCSVSQFQQMLPLLIGISHPSIQFGGERGVGGGPPSDTTGASYYNKHLNGGAAGGGGGKGQQMPAHKLGGGLSHFPPVIRE